MTEYVGKVFAKSCEDMSEIPDGSIQMCCTSPPYYGLRDYGVAGQIGLEPTLTEYVERLVGVFREVRRVLRPDGLAFLNLGDSYANASTGGNGATGGRDKSTLQSSMPPIGTTPTKKNVPEGLKVKDLIGVPWRVAFALQADGWWLRDAIVWCLAPSTRVYARTQKGEGPATLHDLARLDPTTVCLWNGEKWTRVLGWGPTPCDDPVRLTLRSGETVSATPNHEWPLTDGRVVRTDALCVGDVLASTKLPEPDEPIGDGLEDLAWFAGLYLAEGSRSDDAIQLAGNEDEIERMERVHDIVRRHGGSAVTHVGPGRSVSQVVHGAVLDGALRHFVAGRTANDKHLHPRAWSHSNAVLRAFLMGYLQGDGHDDAGNNRWRLGFTRNPAWANDLRTLAARLGATLTLNPSLAKIGRTRVFEAYRGEIRFEISDHWNRKERAEIVKVERGAPGDFIDVAVEDDPHLFALASGVLTHNCKPNPMPSSVEDRCTSSYEMVFMLAKSARYFADMDAVREPLSPATLERIQQAKWKSGEQAGSTRANGGAKTNGPMRAVVNAKGLSQPPQIEDGNYSEAGANLRNVWTIATTPFTGWTKTVRRAPVAAGERGDDTRRITSADCPEHGDSSVADSIRAYGERVAGSASRTSCSDAHRAQAPTSEPCSIIADMPSCTCEYVRETSESTSHFATMPLELALRCIRMGSREGDVILDPFMGSGTTAQAAESVGRRFVGYELNPEYHALIAERIKQPGLFGGAA